MIDADLQALIIHAAEIYIDAHDHWSEHKRNMPPDTSSDEVWNEWERLDKDYKHLVEHAGDYYTGLPLGIWARDFTFDSYEDLAAWAFHSPKARQDIT